MRRRRHHASTSTHASAPQRALAWLLAGLVLALTLVSVSPQAHALIHGHDAHDDAVAHGSHGAPCHHGHAHAHADAHRHDTVPVNDDDHTCAVVLFAQGVGLPLAFPHVTVPRADFVERVAVSARELFLTTPRYLRQPERGPPVS